MTSEQRIQRLMDAGMDREEAIEWLKRLALTMCAATGYRSLPCKDLFE